ncbi:hypothetical protein Tco_0709119 [Tanacetum coccineum]
MLTKPQVFYDENHKTALGYQNPLYLTKAQRKQPVLYCGHTLVKKHDALSMIDSEKTLDLAEATRLKMNEKQNNPIVKEKRVKITPIDYASLNKLSEHFVLHFVPQKQLQSFADFELGLYREVYEMKAIFEQMKTEVEQCFVEKRYFEIEKKELLIVCTAMHSNDDLVKYAEMEQSYIDEYSRQFDHTLVNCHTVAKEIWDRVKLLIEGTELSLQERESKLYNEFDRFTSEKGKTIHSYYLRFAWQINDMNMIGMTMK